jgi:NAD+ kinase
MTMKRRFPVKKIGIVVNQNKKNALELLGKIRQWLKKRGMEPVDNTRVSLEEAVSGVSLVICLGGDGTLLNLSHVMTARAVPILGVHMGNLGFLTEVKSGEVFEELEAYFSGSSETEERLMLSCVIKDENGRTAHELVALNDIVISREGLSRLVLLDVCAGGEKLTGFSGDGIIVSTPTGSTAYSLSAGGAIVHPKVGALVVTPICPHASALRCMVVDQDEKITVRILSARGVAKALVTADGQENVEIDDSYTVGITRSKTRLRLVKSSKRSYFETLRENFRFPE